MQYKDIQRFEWFSKGWLAVHPLYPDVIGDMRYSMLPNEVLPLWGIRLKEEYKHMHVPFEGFQRARRGDQTKLLNMIFDR